MTNIADIAIENVPFIVIYLSEMVIFHSYVGLPEASNPLSKTVTKYPSTNRVQLHSSALRDHSCANFPTRAFGELCLHVPLPLTYGDETGSGQKSIARTNKINLDVKIYG